MNTAQELLRHLQTEHKSTEAAVETAISVYQAAKGEQDRWVEVGNAAKELLQEIMVETGQTGFVSRAGKAAVTAPSVSVSYDAKALDALCASDDNLRRILEPHRRVTERAGTLRITAAK